jgi:Zn-dependent protease
MITFLLNGEVSLFLSSLFVLTLAFAYHEFAHAIVADRLGDPTPRSYGRISINPFVHLDRFGMLMLVLAGFGWAVTPVNPNYLRGNPRKSMAWVALAGPAANLIMATIAAIPLRLWGMGIIPPTLMPEWVVLFFFLGVELNLFLMFFNLLPIPPLDGFTVLMGVLPPNLAYQLEPLRQYGVFILLFFIFVPSLVPQMFSLFEVLNPMVSTVSRLLTGLPFGMMGG